MKPILSKTNGKYLLAGFLTGLVVGVLATILIYYPERQENKDYFAFYTAELKGRITALIKNEDKTYFRLDGGKKYMMDPITVSDRQKSFNQLPVREGDSLVKPAFSDTLAIIKGGTKYRFTFKDFAKH